MLTQKSRCLRSVGERKTAALPLDSGKHSFVDRRNYFRQDRMAVNRGSPVYVRRAFIDCLLKFENSIESCQQGGWTIICDGNRIWFNPTV